MTNLVRRYVMAGLSAAAVIFGYVPASVEATQEIELNNAAETH